MGALEGLKVLDFTTLLPGPYATLVLADLGAEVLRVVRPGSEDVVTNWPPVISETDITGTAAWLGRGKRSIFLNLKKDSAVSAVKRLIMDYDILVEQFRPGVMERLGLGYETLKKLNPRLIYCSITGYGQTGIMRDKAGHDCNYLARSGILSAAGRKKYGPALYNFQIADVAAGSNNAVIGILAAVYQRLSTDKGQYIDISMCDGVVPFNSMDGAAFLTGGAEPGREEGLLNGGSIYDLYETADGGYMSVGSLEPKFFARLCEILELTEWKDGKCLLEDPGKVKNAIREKFLTRTRDEWAELFKDADACVEPVLTLREAVEDEQLNERGMWPEVLLNASNVKKIRQPGCPIRLSESPVHYESAGVSEGYHTKEVLSRMGYSEAEISEMVSP